MKKENEQKNIATIKKIKIFSGKVVSDKMKDTVVVLIDNYKTSDVWEIHKKAEKIKGA